MFSMSAAGFFNCFTVAKIMKFIYKQIFFVKKLILSQKNRYGVAATKAGKSAGMCRQAVGRRRAAQSETRNRQRTK